MFELHYIFQFQFGTGTVKKSQYPFVPGKVHPGKVGAELTGTQMKSVSKLFGVPSEYFV